MQVSNSLAYAAPGMVSGVSLNLRVKTAGNYQPVKSTVRDSIAESIIDDVCSFYELNAKHLKNACRTRRLTKARHLAMFVIRHNTSLSLKDVGELFERDHTTVIFGVQRIEDALSLRHSVEKDEILIFLQTYHYAIRETIQRSQP